MKFIADENLYEPIIDYLKSLGLDIFSVRDAGLSGISDAKIFQIACKKNRIIITMDKDFTRIFRFSPAKCGGIIVVKIYKQNVKRTLEIFKKFYNSLNENDITNNLVIITAENVRILRTKF
ncbi:DUF5615 family PIN-like protein [Candidatus Desantisbacteria bacterium]|nr:DUF5615 family PIN-like protein [Candidatus Desantisbacteria bacterium]